LTSAGGLAVSGNLNLTSLAGLKNIDPTTFNISNSPFGSIFISNNPQLSTCAVQSICNALTISGISALIGNNATGCNSQAEVENACPTCPPSEITFSTQAQIDNFTSYYAGCTDLTDIVSSVVISGNSILNLDGLSGLASIGGRLSITDNVALTSLSSLSGLTSIGGRLDVIGNSSLASLDGLSGFTSIGGKLSITDNVALTSLSSLSGLTSIGGYLEISNNITLTSLAGLSSLTSIDGNLAILDNTSLTSLSGFSALTSISGLYVGRNASLTSLAGLSNLTSTGEGGFFLTDNPSLTSLSELSAITSIYGPLIILRNASLTSLAGLENIDPTTFLPGPFSIPPITINDNPQLSTCAAQSICEALDLAGITTNISGNATGCTTRAEIETACSSILPVTWTRPVTAEARGKQALVSWSVADQIDNDYFAVEHSTDGTAFREIGTQSGEVDFVGEMDYQFTHDGPASGANYYRIKQVDYDGGFSFSNIASVDFQFGKVTLYPNPTSGPISVETLVAGRLAVYDFVGRLVMEVPLGVGLTEINLRGYSAGVYVFRVGGEVFRVVKE
jgi:hypothetical protein